MPRAWETPTSRPSVCRCRGCGAIQARADVHLVRLPDAEGRCLGVCIQPGVTWPLLVIARKTGAPKRLTKPEANKLANEFMEALQRVTFSGQPATPEEVATQVRSGLRFFDGRLPAVTENTPPFPHNLLDPLIRTSYRPEISQ